MKFLALDFETANSKKQSVCSIGLAVIENSQIIKTFNRLIKPTPNYFEPINISIHGITQEMTQNEQSFAEIWEEIRPLINDQQLIAHNASFDFSALRAALDAYKLNFPDLEYFCSMLLSKKVFPGLINYQLPTICQHFGILDLDHHDALSDAVASGKIMLKILEQANVNSFEELEKQLKFTPGRIYPNSYNPFSCQVSIISSNKLFEPIKEPEKIDPGHPFYNKHIVFTGAISKLSRNDARQIVESIGGRTTPPSLSGKTNYLVVGTYDYTQFGEGYKSEKLKKAEKLIAEGNDLEIISETDFLRMVHNDSSSSEIKLEQVKKDSEAFLQRNKYNDFSGKNVYFTPELSINRTEAFQHVGNCSGYGHDYDIEEIPNSDFFVISDKILQDLGNGLKHKSILDFEQLRSNAQNRGNVKSIKLLSESTFLEYMLRRVKFQKGEFKMNIHEWEIENK
jgi:DNA polymerase III subunit epsilon